MELLYSQVKSDFLLMPRSQSHFSVLLSSLTEHGLFSLIKVNSTSKDDIISHINVSLSVRSSHREGLCLLHALLRQCSSAVLEENFKTWIDLLMKILESHVDYEVVRPLYTVLTQLLSMITAFPELSRNFVTSTLPRLLTLLVDSKSNFPEDQHCAVLNICKSCIVHFSLSCRPFKNKIEQFCIKHLGNKSKGSRDLAAECFALVARCGVGGGDADNNPNGVKTSSKAAESWTTTLNRILQTLRSVLDQLYADFDTDLTTEKYKNSDKVTESAIFQKLPTIEQSSYYILLSQFSGLTAVLRVMLTEDFPAVVSLPIDSVLDVIFTSLSILPRFILNRPVPDRLRILTVMPQFHAEAMDLCSALVSAAGTNFIPFSENVCRLIAQTLAGYDSSTKSLESSRLGPYTSLRYSVYTLLSVMIKELGMGCGLVTSVESCRDIIKHILRDVQIKPTTLSCSVQTNKSDTSRAFNRKRPYKGGNQRVESASFITGVGTSKFSSPDGDLYAAGLEALRSLITYCGICLTSQQSEVILQFCFSTLKQVQKAEIGCLPVPYNDANCRQALYQLLKALLISRSVEFASPLGVVMKLFSRGMQDSDMEVRSCCREGLAICENIIRPRVGYLVHLPSLPPQLESMAEADKSSGFLGSRKSNHHESLAEADTPDKSNVVKDHRMSYEFVEQDSDIEVRSCCHEGLATCENTIPPRVGCTVDLPSLSPPLESMAEADKSSGVFGGRNCNHHESLAAADTPDKSNLVKHRRMSCEFVEPDEIKNNMSSSKIVTSDILEYLKSNASKDETENSECLQQMLDTFVNADSDSD